MSNDYFFRKENTLHFMNAAGNESGPIDSFKDTDGTEYPINKSDNAPWFEVFFFAKGGMAGKWQNDPFRDKNELVSTKPVQEITISGGEKIAIYSKSVTAEKAAPISQRQIAEQVSEAILIFAGASVRFLPESSPSEQPGNTYRPSPLNLLRPPKDNKYH